MIDLAPGHIEAELVRLATPLGRPLSIAAATTSTSDDARRAAAAGAPHGASFIADTQTAGRGRGGRSWHSPPGESLYLSIVLRPRIEAARIAPVALAVGVAVARAVARRVGPLGLEARIKWPNDVMVGGQKIAGVLVEGQLRGDVVTSLVAGIGVNVGATSLPDALAARATSLALLGASDRDRGALAAELIAGVGDVVALFEREGLGPLLAELAARDALAGERVRVGDASGIACGIDAGGRLLVRGATGLVTPVHAGEASVERDGLAPRAEPGKDVAPT